MHPSLFNDKNSVVSIETSRPVYHVGETILYKVMLNFKEAISIRGIYAFLVYVESKKAMQFRQMTNDEVEDRLRTGIPVGDRTIAEEKIINSEHIFSKAKIAKEGKYKDEKILGKFTIPFNVYPTSFSFDIDNRKVTWYLRVKLDIPFAPDIHAEKEILILPK